MAVLKWCVPETPPLKYRRVGKTAKEEAVPRAFRPLPVKVPPRFSQGSVKVKANIVVEELPASSGFFSQDVISLLHGTIF